MTNGSHKCECRREGHACRLVVVTGGPGAGKTAILEIARRNFCEHIVILPEAAGIVFGGGFPRRHTLPGRKASQRAIFQVQRELERMIVEESKAAIGLCDRGTLDGLAYWPGNAEEFWNEVGTSRERELSRYAAVIHLRTPGQHEGYNLNNPIRIETPAEAAEIDARLSQAWAGHPKRRFIESHEDFLEKAKRAMEIIRDELPACCRGHRLPELGETR